MVSECHFTSGYLPAQFLSTGTNHRTDAYGGSLETACDFQLAVLDAVSARIGASRVGFRICPGNPFNDLHDDDPAETFAHLLQEASKRQLAYAHVIRMEAGVDNILPLRKSISLVQLFAMKAINCQKRRTSSPIRIMVLKRLLLGALLLPILILCAVFKKGLPLEKVDFSKIYTAGADGYTDYPEYSDS